MDEHVARELQRNIHLHDGDPAKLAEEKAKKDAENERLLRELLASEGVSVEQLALAEQQQSQAASLRVSESENERMFREFLNSDPEARRAFEEQQRQQAAANPYGYGYR